MDLGIAYGRLARPVRLRLLGNLRQRLPRRLLGLLHGFLGNHRDHALVLLILPHCDLRRNRSLRFSFLAEVRQAVLLQNERWVDALHDSRANGGYPAIVLVVLSACHYRLSFQRASSSLRVCRLVAFQNGLRRLERLLCADLALLRGQSDAASALLVFSIDCRLPDLSVFSGKPDITLAHSATH